MIRLSLTRADATVTETETLTAGRVGLECAFTFNSDWDGLEKVAVFEGAETIEVALGTSSIAVVPPECMATAGYNLRCGVYGLSTEQAVVIPTVWAKAGKIKDSASPDEETLADFTPTLAAQIIAKANTAEAIANSLNEKAIRGEFDGFSPYVGVSEIENGHRVSITDSVGTKDFDVMDGEDGVDGDSPTIAVSAITGGHVLTITDKNGTRSVNVLNGEDGEDGGPGPAGSPGSPGADGYSPTVTVTTITGGHRVTITDANGTHSFDVMDGEDGEGSSITVDSALSDSSTNPVQNKVVKAALDSKGTYSKPSGGIPDSDIASAATWNAKGTYSKPSGGIPKSDLASAVKTSLGKADTALQAVPSTYRTAAAQDTIDAGKIDADQGTANAGKFMVVDSNGLVIPSATSEAAIQRSVDDWLDENRGSIDGISFAIKNALLACFQNVAWINANGQTYYDALHNALFPPVELDSISAVFNQGSATIYDTDSLDTLKQYLTVTATYSDSSTATVPSADYTLSGTLTEGTSTITVSYQGKNTTFNATVTAAPRWSVTYNLTNFSSSNQATSVVSGSTYVTTLSYDDTQYMFGSVTVTMGGTDITTTAYGDGRVQINEVTGNIVITAIANEIVYNTVLNRQTGSGLQFYDSNGTVIGGKAYQWYGYVPQTASADCTATIKIVNNGESTIGANEKIYAGNTDQFDQSMWVRVYTDCALAYTVSSLGIAPGGSITFTATVKRGYRLVFTSFSGCDVYVTGIPTDAIVYATEYATVIFGAADVTQWYPDDGSGTATTKYYGSNRITTDAFTEDTTVTVIYENGSAASGDVNANDRLFGCCQSAANRQTPIYYFVAPSAAGNAGIPEYGYARYVYEVKAGYHLAIKSNAESALAAGYSVRVVKGNVR